MIHGTRLNLSRPLYNGFCNASPECNEWSSVERRPMSGDGFSTGLGFSAFWTSPEVNNPAHVTRMQSGFCWVTDPDAKASKHSGVSWLGADNEKQSFPHKQTLSCSANSGILLQTHHSTLMWTVLGVLRRLCPWRKTSLFVSRPACL